MFWRLYPKERLGRNDNLIIDATFYRRSWRDRLREAAEGERLLTVFVDCSLETCLKRNREREKPVPEEAIYIIWNEFERPVVHDVHIDTDEVGVERAVETIMRALSSLSTAP